jgi:protein required for attachment to host cells
MKTEMTWVVVADGARARVFRLAENGQDLDPAWEHQLAGSRLRSREIASDRPGRTFDRAGEGRHAKEPPTDPARYEQEQFAHEVAERLEEDRKKNAFSELIIVASPRFLGDLRQSMTDHLDRCVRAEINKDLSKMKPTEILEHLEGVV